MILRRELFLRCSEMTPSFCSSVLLLCLVPYTMSEDSNASSSLTLNVCDPDRIDLGVSKLCLPFGGLRRHTHIPPQQGESRFVRLSVTNCGSGARHRHCPWNSGTAQASPRNLLYCIMKRVVATGVALRQRRNTSVIFQILRRWCRRSMEASRALTATTTLCVSAAIVSSDPVPYRI